MQGELDDPFTYAQIRFMLFLYALLWRSTNVASRLLKSVFAIVERNDIRFVPEYKLLQLQHAPGGPAEIAGGLDRDGLPVPEFSESDYERVVFLASLIGADAGLQLFGLSREAEVSLLDLERQFFDELPVRIFHIRSTQKITKLTLWDPGCIPCSGTDASRVAKSRAAASQPRDQLAEAVQGRKCVIYPLRHANRQLINCRGCHPIVQGPDRLTLHGNRPSSSCHSFTRRRPRRSPHPLLRRDRRSHRYGHPPPYSLTSVVDHAESPHFLRGGPGSPRDVSEKVQEVSERSDQDHEGAG
jgi:hypothetical protein